MTAEFMTCTCPKCTLIRVVLMRYAEVRAAAAGTPELQDGVGMALIGGLIEVVAFMMNDSGGVDPLWIRSIHNYLDKMIAAYAGARIEFDFVMERSPSETVQ